MNICALATARGGAIAVIRISGPDAITIVAHFFIPSSKGKRLVDAKGQTLHYGSFSNSHGEAIDDVLVSIFRAPHSYTGENSAEISCHASTYIINTIIQTLIEGGCRQAKPGEFTQRAYMNGKMDLSQAEAVADVIASTNAAAHRMAMSQLRGNFSSELAVLREKLLHLTSLMELELDFADHEELEFADRSELKELTQTILEKIQRLAKSFQLGNAIKNGVPVAIIGAPNVGKSTLLNALLNEDKAIVSDIQGTTRDLIEDTVTLGDITFRFIDTAGIRHTDDKIEQLGIDRSKKAAEKAHIIILMNEPGVDFPEIETRPEQTIIKITNKTPEFQALNGIGLEQLQKQLIDTIPVAESDEFIVTSARHYEALVNAKNSLQRVIDGMNMGIPTDLVSQDLRECLEHLAEITGGQITTNEVLGNIFQHFCVGK